MDAATHGSTAGETMQDGLADLSNRIDEQARRCHEDRAFLQRSMKETLQIHAELRMAAIDMSRTAAQLLVTKANAESMAGEQ